MFVHCSGQYGEFGERPQPGEVAWAAAGGPAAAGAAGVGACRPPAGQPPGQPQATSNESQTYNQRNLAKWQHDMSLGEAATISPVLYANHKHPELRTEYPGMVNIGRDRIWLLRGCCFESTVEVAVTKTRMSSN